MPYEYQDLQTSEDEDDIYIRLIELYHGPKTGPVVCRIISTLLSEAPVFEAVSYCWGQSDPGTIYITDKDPDSAQQLLADGALADNALNIPGSLIPFLQRTQALGNSMLRMFWIDSICINQENQNEKSIQVPKMRDIYLKAKWTLAWLGPEANGSSGALEFAISLNKVFTKELAKPGTNTLTPEGEKENEEVDVKVVLGDPNLDALLKLLDRPYFERAWIVQEVVISDTVWMVCGNTVISWAAFLGSYLYIIHYHAWLWEFYSGTRFSFLFALRLSEMDWERRREIEWWRVLLRHRMCISGDPRDKIYALYGLGCKLALQQLGIEPDYENTTPETLFTRLAVRSFAKGHADVLRVPRLAITRKQEGEKGFEKIVLPSWVPDWRWTIQTPSSMDAAEGDEALLPGPTYDVSKDSAFQVRFDVPAWNTFVDTEPEPTPLPKLICVRGFVIARVTHLTPRPWEIHTPSGRQTLMEQGRLLQTTQQQVYEWETAMRPLKPSQIYDATGEPYDTATYETFMTGTSVYTSAEKEAAAQGFERRQRILRLIPIFHLQNFFIFYLVFVLIERVLRYFSYTHSETAFRIMVLNMTNRKGARLFSEDESSQELLGLVPGICGLGDYVVLVQGVKLPLVLRWKGEEMVQVDESRRKTVPVWEFLGNSYIHGVMNGKRWDAGRCEDLWIG
ncbi:hypothetical protein P153DRAFT_333514 [Dothidotthia symphoricarpi CBS 119687]|uniref:Heterokaryon incompatibility domain-containing protein n=1 Tax=Dothidotthia symphoricarpi CBS 119687 TaxID=1392245 RepID=A0A6A6ALP6_9PLEO|nr:uncharacterized protein P153DRAFT_333514 [Dothidotthia symphoricarpi CBS 119687]KAF2132859.1 hypothetical protein P153DRAFT_333514 [Dothidotthia symphoricarpi CBS 119687]